MTLCRRAAVREAEDALAKAEAQLLLATTPEEKAAALAAIEAAKERIETETRKAESQIALRKAEEMLANATTEEERQAALAMLDAAKAEVASAEAAVEAVRTKQKNGETNSHQPRIYLPPPSCLFALVMYHAHKYVSTIVVATIS